MHPAGLIATIAVIGAFLGGAEPAAADDLVGNLSALRNYDLPLSENDYAQAFTTGANVTGYQIESISLHFDVGSTTTTDPVYVYLYEDNGSGRPRSRAIARLTRNGVNFLPPVAGLNRYRVWKSRCYPQPPHGGGCLSDASSVHVAPNSTYWVYVWGGRRSTAAALQLTASLDETGAAGWTIANEVLDKPDGSAHSNFSATNFAPIKMKVEGTTNPVVNVSISDVTVTEGIDATADFVVSLSQATGGPVSMDFETSAGTASDSGSFDYFDTDGTLTFMPGETEKTVSVSINDDAIAESDETFDVVLSNLRGANSFADDTGTATIVNAVPLAVSINDASAVEGTDETIDFRVSLNRTTVKPVTINVLFSSGTADFNDITQPDETSVTFQPGERRKTYSYGVVDDGVNEPSESFQAVLQYSGPATHINVGSPGTGTITNTETLEASFENVPASHDGSNFSFNVAFTAEVSISPQHMRDWAFKWKTER